jgi:hypothetical protein
MPCPRCGGGNYRLKVSNTMSNTDTATQGPNVIHEVDFAHRVADLEDSLRTDIKNGSIDFLGRTLHKYLHVQDQVFELRHASYEDVQAHEYRVSHLWHKLWDALSGDIERDETWGIFIDAIPGLPDLRKETVSGSITLTFGFSELEIPGGLSGGERDDAIIEAYLDDNDFDQDYADSTEVTEH